MWSNGAMDEVEIVAAYLRGQNLEQLGRTDEAIEAYEGAVRAGFDSAGPYDRLIALYGREARHADVIRVVDAALGYVRTYPDKKARYRSIRSAAERARDDVPRATPKRS